MGIKVDEPTKEKKRRKKIMDAYKSTQELSALKHPKDEIVRRANKEKDPDKRKAMMFALTTPGASKEANKRRRGAAIFGEHKELKRLRKSGGGIEEVDKKKKSGGKSIITGRKSSVSEKGKKKLKKEKEKDKEK
tara:strand:- start:66 stop:467 length:402 start_codon:yes stop_codon:yes gene_type:complete